MPTVYERFTPVGALPSNAPLAADRQIPCRILVLCSRRVTVNNNFYRDAEVYLTSQGHDVHAIRCRTLTPTEVIKTPFEVNSETLFAGGAGSHPTFQLGALRPCYSPGKCIQSVHPLAFSDEW